jgi:hypothetical protein
MARATVNFFARLVRATKLVAVGLIDRARTGVKSNVEGIIQHDLRACDQLGMKPDLVHNSARDLRELTTPSVVTSGFSRQHRSA